MKNNNSCFWDETLLNHRRGSSQTQRCVQADKLLESRIRDALDNIEDYSFQIFLSSSMDELLDYQILPARPVTTVQLRAVC